MILSAAHLQWHAALYCFLRDAIVAEADLVAHGYLFPADVEDYSGDCG
jgi:hypothetical protein